MMPSYGLYKGITKTAGERVQTYYRLYLENALAIGTPYLSGAASEVHVGFRRSGTHKIPDLFAPRVLSSLFRGHTAGTPAWR